MGDSKPVMKHAIKKETPDNEIPAKVGKTILNKGDDVVCIDIDDDYEELLNDSVLNDSVTLTESQRVSQKPTSIDKGKAKQEESSKDEILHLLMEQIKELEKFVQTNSSPELEKFKKQMKVKVVEVEHLQKDVQSRDEELVQMVRKSEQQGQQFVKEVHALKVEIGELKSKTSSATDSNAVTVRISELEKMLKCKEEDQYILKNKLDLVEKVANNKVQMYKEKLEEAEKSKSSGDSELKKKYETLQKDFSEKVDVVKSLESRIPKMIEEFTKYVEEKDSLHIIKEGEFKKSISDKEMEVSEANKKYVKISDTLASKTQEVQVLKLREKQMKETREKFMNTIEQKEREILESQENHRKLQNLQNQKKKQFEMKIKELQAKSTEFNDFKDAQIGLNEKYKKLLTSKDKELDQAEKDSLELQERIKKLKEENKKKKSSDSKELDVLKETKNKLKKENGKKDKEIELKLKEMVKLKTDLEKKSKELELKSKEIIKLEVNVQVKTERISKLEETHKALQNSVAQADVNFKSQKAELSEKADSLTSYQIKTQKLTKLNNELKHQYNQLSKIYNKSAGDVKKQDTGSSSAKAKREANEGNSGKVYEHNRAEGKGNFGVTRKSSQTSKLAKSEEKTV